MSELKFKFEDSQQYQLDAIAAMKRIPPKSKPLLAATLAPTNANAKVETRSSPKTKRSRSTSGAYFLSARRASRRMRCSAGSGTGTAEISRLVYSFFGFFRI